MTSKSTLPALLALALLAPATANAQAAREICDNGIDDDGDTVYDCGDADCFGEQACQPDGRPENTNARCEDWVDNDSDGMLDCDDANCYGAGLTVCQGSWDRTQAKAQDVKTSAPPVDEELPVLGEGMTVEDLLGRGSDNDGERNEQLCSDGIDNDNDGRIDCADFGCRFDPAVTVCQGEADFRFSVVARAQQEYDFEADTTNTRISTLQLRAFGPMPAIQNSFFLLSMRAEKTPRLTFAMFQVPLGQRGHYLNVNSGGGGLSVELVRSAHKRLLIEPAYYLYNAFEQGNGAALEIGGPIDTRGRLLYRTFVAGGTGRFSGNVGGGFVSDQNDNYTWSVGAQLRMNLLGYASRWDSSMLFVPAPLTLSLAVGGKYDQRSQERYPATNVNATFKSGRLILVGETYAKRELAFKSWQYAYNVKAGFLLVPKMLLVAADFGEYLTTEMKDPPAELGPALRRQLQETQWRAALHYYLWRNIVTVTGIYKDRRVDPPPGSDQQQVTREAMVIGSYRF